MKSYDVVVIGSGPGGYLAAAKAGANGLNTALVEKDKFLGGTCLHRGCIPTKFLLNAAEKYSDIKKISDIGINYKYINVDWNKIIKYRDKIISKHEKGVQYIVKSNKVSLYNGQAQIQQIEEDRNIIKIVTDNAANIIKTKKIIIAIGSRPRRTFMDVKISGSRILNSDDILKIKNIPNSLVIVGGGVIGCEFASIFSQFHTNITILESFSTILPMADKDCISDLHRSFTNSGVKIKNNARVTNIVEEDDSITVSYTVGKDSFTLTSEYCLISTGRQVNTDNIFSSEIKTTTRDKILENEFIKVDKYMHTPFKGIYAIGDCVNTPWLAHVASAEAIVAVDHICTNNSSNTIDYNKIPTCVYSSPSIAWCGLSEDKVLLSREYINIVKYPLIRNGKASIMLEKHGFIKLISDKETHEILGVHILGKNSTELISEPAFAMQIDATVEEIATTVHAHPTLYESIYEAALMAFNTK